MMIFSSSTMKLWSVTLLAAGIATTSNVGVVVDAQSFSDEPRYGDELWVYQQVNLVEAWDKGYTGSGVHVRVNDYDLQPDHPEYASRFDMDASCTRDNGFGGSSDDFTPGSTARAESHGTFVTSILAATADNNQCSAGVAPSVTISACGAFSAKDIFSFKIEEFDISQNSFSRPACSRRRLEAEEEEMSRKLDWVCPFTVSSRAAPCTVCDTSGFDSKACESAIRSHCITHFEDEPTACGDYFHLMNDRNGGNCVYRVLKAQELAAFTNSIRNGRQGLGTVYVFSAGNSQANGETTGVIGYTNSRYTITVGATGSDGFHASYANTGSSMFVTAPGGDSDERVGHVGALNGDRCGSFDKGTSFSAPVVSGIIALMLEANPILSWRDVQGILAETSQKVEDDPHGDDTAKTNAAGYWHSNKYGFGIIDAGAAVSAAETWLPYRPEIMFAKESAEENILITEVIGDDDPTHESVITIGQEDEIHQNFVVENVEILIDVEHERRGDLDIVLVSPAGTVSLMHPGKRPEETDLDDNERWVLLTVANWGEQAIGDWKLQVTDIQDTVDSSNDNVLVQWSIALYGREGSAAIPQEPCSEDVVLVLRDEATHVHRADDSLHPEGELPYWYTTPHDGALPNGEVPVKVVSYGTEFVDFQIVNPYDTAISTIHTEYQLNSELRSVCDATQDPLGPDEVSEVYRAQCWDAEGGIAIIDVWFSDCDAFTADVGIATPDVCQSDSMCNTEHYTFKVNCDLGCMDARRKRYLR